jgi:hypothetical protein
VANVTFFRQGRYDGGIRTGVETDGVLVWHRFEKGTGEEDPALLWYVDLRCEGDDLPSEREQAREWLMHQAPVIKSALNALAEKLRAGYDDELWPYLFPVPDSPPGTSMKIVCSTTRGLEPGDLAKTLKRIGSNWRPILRQLRPAEVYS